MEIKKKKPLGKSRSSTEIYTKTPIITVVISCTKTKFQYNSTEKNGWKTRYILIRG